MKNILSIAFLSLVLVLAACEMPAGVETDGSASSLSSTSAASVMPETSSSSTSDSDSDTSSSDSSGSSVSSSESSATSASESSSETSSASETSSSSSSDASETSSSSEGGADTSSSPSAKRTIEISADNWAFSPSAVTAKKGEVLEIRLTGIAGTHGFAVPELGINVTIAAGETATVAIPADAAGTFSFLCSVPCGTGHRDMTGTITIAE